jgi:AbrB family looped-hinge helix DNA binding protein
MNTVTISPKYQIVIPKDIRESLGLRPGQRVQVLQYGDRLELIPLVPVAQMRGFLRGIDTDVPRDADRS